jgi:thiamine biosynthesis lipoprotein
MSSRPLVLTAPPVARRAFVEQVMGLPVSVHLRGHDLERPEVEGAVRSCFAQLRRADQVFSTWRDDSDLMRLRRAEIGVGDAHPWLADVIDLCIEAEERTAGRFSAWYQQQHDGRRLFDPTGLVKGWAVASAAAHLGELYDISYCINAGGDVVAGTGRRATPDLHPHWRVGIEDPRDRSRVAAVLTVSQGAVATSGTAARGHHILDPRKSRKVVRPGSATVYGPDLMWADVWATAAFVDAEGTRALMAQAAPDYHLLTL